MNETSSRFLFCNQKGGMNMKSDDKVIHPVGYGEKLYKKEEHLLNKHEMALFQSFFA